MALNKNSMDLKAINRDQKAIDRLPNRGRAFVDNSKKASMAKKMSSSPQGQANIRQTLRNAKER